MRGKRKDSKIKGGPRTRRTGGPEDIQFEWKRGGNYKLRS